MSRNGQFYPPSACALEVRSRAKAIVGASTSITRNTLSSLESLMRSSAQLAGRKLVFFVSDGFFVDNKTSNVSDRLQRITDAAVRAGVVIYTIDARGLVSGSLDATGSTPFDMDGRLEMANLNSIPASQDALNMLAAETGGRALRNTNVIGPFVSRTVKETARYYLLAWRPESDEQRQGKFRRVEVNIKGRPELSVRLSRGFIETATKTQTPSAEKSATREKAATPESQLRDALAAPHPKSSLPVMLDLNYIDAPKHGTILTSSVQVSFETEKERAATFDVLGVALDDKGKPVADFKTRLNVSALAASGSGDDAERSDVIYNHRAPLAPGLYQVRVAARDTQSGRTGSAMQWIEIPNLASRELALSSLLVGLQDVPASAGEGGRASAQQETQVQFSVDHRFARGSRLRFLTFIYNAQAARPASATRDDNDNSRDNSVAADKPDLALQVQIFRDDQPVVTLPLRKVSLQTDADPARLPYEAEISLGSLPAGRYLLQVTVLDRRAKQSATQRARFEIV
jgi:hypothetical protein